MGQIERIADEFIAVAQRNDVFAISSPIAVLAVDPSVQPEENSLQILANEGAWFGLLCALHKSATASSPDPAIISKLKDGLCRVKVCFHVAKQQDVQLQKKWEIDHADMTMQATFWWACFLHDFRKVVAVVWQIELLQVRIQPCRRTALFAASRGSRAMLRLLPFSKQAMPRVMQAQSAFS